MFIKGNSHFFVKIGIESLLCDKLFTRPWKHGAKVHSSCLWGAVKDQEWKPVYNVMSCSRGVTTYTVNVQEKEQ